MRAVGTFKAVYYLNQFFAGLGGEEMADLPWQVLTDKRGPARKIVDFWGGALDVVQVFVAGDNFLNNEANFKGVLPEIERIIREVEPDVFLAGPAFNSGRYGVACAKLCQHLQTVCKVPSVTAMYPENPAVPMYVQDIYIVPTSPTAAGMKEGLRALAGLALKLAAGEKIGPARQEGYLPTGHRFNEYHEKTGARRTVEILLKKLKGEEYVTEVPSRKPGRVAAAEPVLDLSRAKVALVTTGGLVPKGNPDKLKQAFSVTYGKYSIDGLDFLPAGEYESIHGGYDTTFVNQDPHRLVPLDELRALVQEGKVGKIHGEFFSTCGVGTNVASSKRIGQGLLGDLRQAAVDFVLLTST